MVRLVRALTVASVLLAACSSNDTAIAAVAVIAAGHRKRRTIGSDTPTTTSVGRQPDVVWPEVPADGVAGVPSAPRPAS